MREDLTIAKKSKDYGSQLVSINPRNLAVVCTSVEPDAEEKLIEALEAGYSVLKWGNDDNYTVYRTEATDGLVRNLREHVEIMGWNPNVPLYNRENNSVVWCDNINVWFDNFFQDKDAMLKVQNKANVCKYVSPKVYKGKKNEQFNLPSIINSAKEWLITRPCGDGKTSGRPTNINRFLYNYVKIRVDNYLFKNCEQYRNYKRKGGKLDKFTLTESC